MKDNRNQIKVPERQIYTQKDSITAKHIVRGTLRNYGVLWGLPMDEVMFSIWFSNFVHLPVMPWDSFSICMNTYLPMARNTIHNAFIESGLEWLVMLDSDVLPPPTFLDKLLASKKKMVGGWYRKKGGAGYPVVYDYVKTDEKGIHWHNIRKVPGSGLEKVDAAGAGCWLMHRDVAKAIGTKPYNEEHGGEDLDLCVKVNKAGFNIYIDWEIACAHAGVGVI